MNNYKMIKTVSGSISQWCRVWTDNWCEQGGTLTDKTASKVITFLKAYKSVPGVITTICTTRGSSSYDGEIMPRAITTTNFTFGNRLTDISRWTWYSYGFVS